MQYPTVAGRYDNSYPPGVVAYKQGGTPILVADLAGRLLEKRTPAGSGVSRTGPRAELTTGCTDEGPRRRLEPTGRRRALNAFRAGSAGVRGREAADPPRLRHGSRQPGKPHPRQPLSLGPPADYLQLLIDKTGYEPAGWERERLDNIAADDTQLADEDGPVGIEDQADEPAWLADGGRSTDYARRLRSAIHAWRWFAARTLYRITGSRSLAAGDTSGGFPFCITSWPSSTNPASR